MEGEAPAETGVDGQIPALMNRQQGCMPEICSGQYGLYLQ